MIELVDFNEVYTTDSKASAAKKNPVVLDVEVEEEPSADAPAAEQKAATEKAVAAEGSGKRLLLKRAEEVKRGSPN